MFIICSILFAAGAIFGLFIAGLMVCAGKECPKPESDKGLITMHEVKLSEKDRAKFRVVK